MLYLTFHDNLNQIPPISISEEDNFRCIILFAYRKFKLILVEVFKSVYAHFLDNIDLFNKNKFDDRNMFNCVLRASFAKTIEFNYYLHHKATKDEGFFFTPVLRGICEDIIVLKFISDNIRPKHNELISLMTGLELTKNIEAQDKFFTKNRPYQPVVRQNEYGHKSNYQSKIKGLINSLGIKGDKMPPVEQMAMKVGLSEVYEFLYRASSNFVHFNPAVLLRFGWKKFEEEKYSYSTKNFHEYYFFFSKIYGSYLFSLFAKEFKKVLSIKGDFLSNVKILDKELNNMLTWYELVTFEELNLKRPSEILTVMNKVILENEAKKNVK